MKKKILSVREMEDTIILAGQIITAQAKIIERLKKMAVKK